MLRFFEDYLERQENLHRDFEAAISGLSVEALDWAPGPDMNSLCVLVVHTTGAERYWIGEVAGGIPANRDRAAEFRARGLDEAALKQRLADSRKFTRDLLETFTWDSLGKECFSPIRNETVTAGWALLHGQAHTGLHTSHAQITRQLWDQRLR